MFRRMIEKIRTPKSHNKVSDAVGDVMLLLYTQEPGEKEITMVTLTEKDKISLAVFEKNYDIQEFIKRELDSDVSYHIKEVKLEWIYYAMIETGLVFMSLHIGSLVIDVNINAVKEMIDRFKK